MPHSVAGPSTSSGPIVEAMRALDEEVDPGTLREAATAVRAVAPELAAALVSRARRAVRLRVLMARALAGDLFPD